MSPASKIVIANWKANPTSLEEAQVLFSAEASEASRYSKIKTVICPPFVYLEELAKSLPANFRASSVSLGVQDIWESAGSFTGEISPEMVRNFGAQYVLIGHSDRRYALGESDEIINRKLTAALRFGLIPVLLVGEKERGEYREDILRGQLLKDLAGLKSSEVAKVLVTYEPVWAISTKPDGQSDTPAEVVEAIDIIRDILAKNWKLNKKHTLVLYGGSVNEYNILSFMERSAISGAVVGGASLSAEKFGQILKLTETA